jgi:hypothetical protein
VSLFEVVEQRRRSHLAAYHAAPNDVREHAGMEEAVCAGGHGYRQVPELVQSGADAILEGSEQTGGLRHAVRVEVVLTDRYQYAANSGAPLDELGPDVLLQSHSSRKRGSQIGRFGLGFKSLFSLGGTLDIFSSTEGIRFDPARCRRTIRDETR